MDRENTARGWLRRLCEDRVGLACLALVGVSLFLVLATLLTI